MSRIVEGRLIYFGPPGQEHDAFGNPRPPTPAYCPICGLRLYYHEWNSDPVYPVWRCDGAIGVLPIIGALWRRLFFSGGRHYTFEMPPFRRGAEEGRFDPHTGEARWPKEES